jgi:trigger factor
MAEKYTYVVSKTDDGTIQISFTFPFEIVNIERAKVIEEEAKNITVPGFRKGMAPTDKVAENISKETLIQKTLSGLLPEALSESIKKENLIVAIYPRFELISANENEPWQVRAVSCDLPTLDLGDYKNAILNESKKVLSSSDEKNGEEKKKDLTPNEKETIVLKKLIETSKVNIPKLLIEEDVNQRLSSLLERIERLGLNLENYLSSVGKTPEILRKEYEKQSEESLILEIALNKIADAEKIEISEIMLEEAVKASSADPMLAEQLKNPEKKKVLASVLRRQETLKHLISLI